MGAGDFRSNEQSVTVDATTTLASSTSPPTAPPPVLKDGLALLAGEVIDGTFMSARRCCAFLAEQIADADEQGVLFSLHLKATMMKVSDPIIFGHACGRTSPTCSTATATPSLASVGADPNDGLAACWTPSRTAGRPARGDRGRHRRRLSSPARTWPWSTPTGASPTCTCPATSSSTRRCRR
jgi:monomeric isocitrate dehydrogenase